MDTKKEQSSEKKFGARENFQLHTGKENNGVLKKIKKIMYTLDSECLYVCPSTLQLLG